MRQRILFVVRINLWRRRRGHGEGRIMGIWNWLILGGGNLPLKRVQQVEQRSTDGSLSIELVIWWNYGESLSWSINYICKELELLAHVFPIQVPKMPTYNYILIKLWSEMPFSGFHIFLSAKKYNYRRVEASSPAP